MMIARKRDDSIRKLGNRSSLVNGDVMIMNMRDTSRNVYFCSIMRFLAMLFMRNVLCISSFLPLKDIFVSTNHGVTATFRHWQPKLCVES